MLDERSDETIANIVSFYDYLEIQPVGNNEFMIGSERVENVNSIEDIQKFNQKIVDLGEQFHKPTSERISQIPLISKVFPEATLIKSFTFNPLNFTGC